MDFPKDEHQSLRARLAAGKPIYTTRISAERGRYEPGTDVSSPLGPLRVASLKSFKGLANHPFRGELTDSHRAELKGKTMDLLMLHKAASALVRLSRSSRGGYPSLGRAQATLQAAVRTGTPEERELVLGAASTLYEPEKKASWVKDDLPWYATAAGATAGTLAASRFVPKKYRAVGQIGGALLGTAAGLEGGKALGRKLEKTAMALEMHKQASVDMYVDKSEDMDRGMFAERDFEPGEVLEIAPVLVVPRTQIRNSDVLRNYVFNFDKDNVMVALGYASMFNHSYEPNARYKKDKGSRTLTFTAIKPIKAGQEIFVNYNLDPNNKSPLWFDVKEKQTEKTAAEERDWKQTAKRWAPVAGGIAAGGALAAGGIVAAHPALRAHALADLKAIGVKGGSHAVDRARGLPPAAIARSKMVAAKLKEMGIDPRRHRVAISATGGTGKSTLAKGLSDELGMGMLQLDDVGKSLSGRDIPKFLRKGGKIGPGTIAEQTHLTNQVNPDQFDYMLRLEADPRQLEKQIIARGRGAGQLAVYDYPKLHKSIKSGFELTEGAAQEVAPGVFVKARPQGGFRSTKHISAELERRGMKPTGNRQKDLITLAQGSKPLLPGILPYLKTKNMAAGAGLVGGGAAAGGAAGNYLATKEAAMRRAMEKMV